MTHDHPHDHTHGHNHGHNHGHSHHHHHHAKEVVSTLTFEEKMIKLLEHWITHNADHSATYAEWAKKARESGLAEVSALLVEAGEITRTVSDKFEAALIHLRKK